MNSPEISLCYQITMIASHPLGGEGVALVVAAEVLVRLQAEAEHRRTVMAEEERGKISISLVVGITIGREAMTRNYQGGCEVLFHLSSCTLKCFNEWSETALTYLF